VSRFFPAGPAHRSGWSADALLVAAWVAVTLVTLPHLSVPGAPAHRGVDAGAVALVVAAGVATVLRHRWPLPAMLGAVAATSLYLVLDHPYGPVLGFVVVTVYNLARRVRFPSALAGAAGALVLLSAHLLTGEENLLGLVPATAWIVVPLSMGAARRAVVRAGVREREAADQRLVDAERLRLSQEVHDVVGHGLTAIQMQADIALHVRSSRPEQAWETLEQISRASGEALDELRATLAAVHPETSGPQTRAPTPGLARLDDLVDRVEQAGVDVDVEVTGTPRPLPAAADVAAYRVLQESLTNVVKHSPHPRVRLRVAHMREAVTLTVVNEALSAHDTPGIGISGMRRRVAQVGGSLSAGPDPATGTFRVHARLPRRSEEIS
jgi:signal transduction histidine kinase